MKNNSNNTPWIIGGLAVFGTGLYWYISNKKISNKKQEIIDWVIDKQPQRIEELKSTLAIMSNQEITDIHLFIFEYSEKNKELIIDSAFQIRIGAIAEKYAVFS